jgi:DNA polymerase lambda
MRLSDAVRFTASPSSKKRAINLLADDSSLKQQVEPSPKKRKIPALKLITLAPPVRTKMVTDGPHPQTSPIEDANDLLPIESVPVPPTSDNSNKAALQAGPSRLYLEVKERVAQHSSTKRRDKVIKLNTKAVPKTAVQPSEPSIIDISSSPPPSDRASSLPAPLPSIATKSTSINRDITKNDKSKPKPIKGKKGKPPAMTPVEYANNLREKATLASGEVSKKKSVNKFLEGMNIFYTGGDMQFASEQTRGRMSLVCSSLIFLNP